MSSAVVVSTIVIAYRKNEEVAMSVLQAPTAAPTGDGRASAGREAGYQAYLRDFGLLLAAAPLTRLPLVYDRPRS
jgi:hypothetical protein